MPGLVPVKLPLVAVHVPLTSLDTAKVELSQTEAPTVSAGLLSTRITDNDAQAPFVPVIVTFWLTIGALIAGGLKVTEVPGLVPVKLPEPVVQVTDTLLLTAAVVLSQTVAGTVKVGALSTRIVAVGAQVPLVTVIVTFWFTVGADKLGGLNVTEVPGLVPVKEPADADHVPETVLLMPTVVLSQTVAGTVSDGLALTVTLNVPDVVEHWPNVAI